MVVNEPFLYNFSDFVPLGELQSKPGETFINTLFNWTSSPRKHFKFDHQSRLFQNDSQTPRTHSHTIQSQLAIPIVLPILNTRFF